MIELVDRERYTFRVTQADIDGGCRSEGENCPISKAAVRVLGRPVFTCEISIDIPRPGASIISRPVARLCLPPSARHFIEAFDNEEAVNPFRFSAILKVWFSDD